MFDTIPVESMDMVSRGVSRTLLQFRQSPVFHSVLQALMSEIQVFIDEAVDVIYSRMPATAYGEQLDAIGRIVGQLRGLIKYDTIVWFTPDIANCSPDKAPAWVRTARVSGNYLANDVFYRQLIEGKVTRNFMQFCSVPELKRFCRQAFDMDVGFVTIDKMTLQIVVPNETSENIKNLLRSYYDTALAEWSYFLPLAATVGISSVITLSEYNNDSSS